MFEYFLSLLLGYFIGSLPTAYLLVKWKTCLDVREAGSGNVGAMNTFNVTGSKFLGALVMVIDLLKGVSAVWLTSLLLGKEFWIIAVGGLGSMAGHSYPVWLKFKGGRGLSTAAGVMMILGWIFVAIWCSLWTIMYVSFRNIHLSNIAASISTPIVIILTPENLISKVLPHYTEANNFLYLSVLICLFILVRHLEPISEMLKSLNKTYS